MRFSVVLVCVLVFAITGSTIAREAATRPSGPPELEGEVWPIAEPCVIRIERIVAQWSDGLKYSDYHTSLREINASYDAIDAKLDGRLKS